MKRRDLQYHIINPLVRAAAWGIGAVACALVIPIVFSFAVAIAG